MLNFTETTSPNDSIKEDVFPKALQIIYFCIGIPLGAVICLGNVVLLTVIARKKGPLRDSTRNMMSSLVFCDLTAGCLLIIHISFVSFQEEIRNSSQAGCLAWGLVLAMPMTCSLLHLCIICLERKRAVSEPATIISHRQSFLICIGLWTYSSVLCLIGMFFLLDEEYTGHDIWRFCDILPLPGYYLLILALHVLFTVLLQVYFAINIRNTLQLHQRKIQVTNTITYSNLIEDIKLGWIFFKTYAFQLVFILPLCIMLVIIYAGVHAPASLIIARICYLIAQIPALKFILFFKMNKDIYKATMKKLGCSKSPPRMSPSHTP